MAKLEPPTPPPHTNLTVAANRHASGSRRSSLRPACADSAGAPEPRAHARIGSGGSCAPPASIGQRLNAQIAFCKMLTSAILRWTEGERISYAEKKLPFYKTNIRAVYRSMQKFSRFAKNPKISRSYG